MTVVFDNSRQTQREPEINYAFYKESYMSKEEKLLWNACWFFVCLFNVLWLSQDTGKGLVSLVQLEISKAFVSDQSYLTLEFSPA